MKPVGVLSVLAIAALFAAMPGVAHADGWRIASPLDSKFGDDADAAVSSFYVAPEISYRVQNLPRFHIGAVSATNSTPFYSTGITGDGPSGGVALGYLLPIRSVIGRNARVELSFNVFDLTDHSSHQFSPDAPGLWLPVGGGSPLNTGGVRRVDLHTELDGGEVALRVATDLPLTSGFTVTPAVAIFGGASDRRIKYRDGEECSGSLCYEDTLDERVRATDVGATISLGSRWILARGLSLLFGTGVSLVHSHARLNAADCFDRGLGVNGCQPTFPGDATAATATHDDLGYRLMGKLGLRYNFGVVSLGLFGDIHYGSGVPVINNPNHANQVATLSSSSQLGYAGTLRLTIPFGGAPQQ